LTSCPYVAHVPRGSIVSNACAMLQRYRTADLLRESERRRASELLGTIVGFFDLRLEDDVTVVGSESFRRCACAHLFRPFRVLVVWVLIRRDEIPTEMSKMTPALENHSPLKRLSFRCDDQTIVLAPCLAVRVTPV